MSNVCDAYSNTKVAVAMYAPPMVVVVAVAASIPAFFGTRTGRTSGRTSSSSSVDKRAPGTHLT